MIALDFTFFWSRKVKQTQGKVIIFLKKFFAVVVKKVIYESLCNFYENGSQENDKTQDR